LKRYRCRPTAPLAQQSQHGRRAARPVLCWSGWRHSEGPANASIQNISGLSQGLASLGPDGSSLTRLRGKAMSSHRFQNIHRIGLHCLPLVTILVATNLAAEDLFWRSGGLRWR
jgi:hypothetical protein